MGKILVNEKIKYVKRRFFWNEGSRGVEEGEG